MDKLDYILILFLVQIVTIFFLSRQTIKELFFFLRSFIKGRGMIFSLVSFIFLPGTICHEMAHFLAATILMLKVEAVNIFPRWENGRYIKLGSVLYQKKDILRSIIVGTAPVFFAIGFFWTISLFKIIPNKNMIINILMTYMIFAISSTMFSSKQDLIDLIYIIPLGIIGGGIIYVFNIRLDFIFQNNQLMKSLRQAVQDINLYLFLSIIIHLISILILKGGRIILNDGKNISTKI